MLSGHSWFGIGAGQFKSRYMYHQADYFSCNPGSPFVRMADNINVPFSEPLQIAIEQGVVGLSIASAIIFSVLVPVMIKNGVKKESGQAFYVYAAGLITLLLFSCFSYPFMYIQFHFLLITCLAVLSRSRSGFRIPVVYGKRWFLALIPYLFMTGYVSFREIHYFVYMKKLHRLIVDINVNRPEESVHAFTALEPVLGSDPVFLVSYANILSFNKEYGRAAGKLSESLMYQASYVTCLELGRNYEQAGDTACAIACWELAAGMVPCRFEPIYLQIKSYHQNGQYQQADSLTVLFLGKERKVDAIKIDVMMRDVRRWQRESMALKVENY